MALGSGALEDTLLSAGASPELAAKAAEEVAACRSRPPLGLGMRIVIGLFGIAALLSLLTFLNLLTVNSRLRVSANGNPQRSFESLVENKSNEFRRG
jgi:hypothetical protein